MDKIIILDTIAEEVIVLDFDESRYEDVNEFFEEDPYELGLNFTNMPYMIVNDLNITIKSFPS